jgi:hypothetical protein
VVPIHHLLLILPEKAVWLASFQEHLMLRLFTKFDKTYITMMI